MVYLNGIDAMFLFVIILIVGIALAIYLEYRE